MGKSSPSRRQHSLPPQATPPPTKSPSISLIRVIATLSLLLCCFCSPEPRKTCTNNNRVSSLHVLLWVTNPAKYILIRPKSKAFEDHRPESVLNPLRCSSCTPSNDTSPCSCVSHPSNHRLNGSDQGENRCLEAPGSSRWVTGNWERMTTMELGLRQADPRDSGWIASENESA